MVFLLALWPNFFSSPAARHTPSFGIVAMCQDILWSFSCPRRPGSDLPCWPRAKACFAKKQLRCCWFGVWRTPQPDLNRFAPQACWGALKRREVCCVFQFTFVIGS